MAKKTGLGKGLDALLPQGFENTIDTSLHQLKMISIDQIKPNELQPRKNFDTDALNSLSQSISRNGVIQPLLLRKLDIGYEIIAGERRWRAARLAELKEVPAIIIEGDELKRYELSVIENMQRVQLNPLEEALAYRELIGKYEVTQEQMAEIVGKSRAYITNSMRLLNLDDRVKDMIADGKISTGHAKVLMSQNQDMQYQFALMVVDKDLSVRALEILIKNSMREQKEPKEKPINFEAIEIEKQLSEIVGTKIKVKAKKKNNNLSGKIEIEFYSDDDVDRILGFFGIE